MPSRWRRAERAFQEEESARINRLRQDSLGECLQPGPLLTHKTDGNKANIGKIKNLNKNELYFWLV